MKCDLCEFYESLANPLSMLFYALLNGKSSNILWRMHAKQNLLVLFVDWLGLFSLPLSAIAKDPNDRMHKLKLKVKKWNEMKWHSDVKISDIYIRPCD